MVQFFIFCRFFERCSWESNNKVYTKQHNRINQLPVYKCYRKLGELVRRLDFRPIWFALLQSI